MVASTIDDVVVTRTVRVVVVVVGIAMGVPGMALGRVGNT